MYSEKNTSKYQNNVDIVFFIYWAVLVLWQNINPGGTGTMYDTLIKTALFGITIVYFLLHTKGNNFKYFGVFIIFAINILISFLSERYVSLRTILNYFFPVLLSFFTLIIGSKYEIRKSQLIRFLNCVIAVVLYTALYAMLFMPEYFVNALSIDSAYGNELSSFFYSNHEYALYLLSGIISCIFIIELDKGIHLFRKILYVVCGIIFGINLILTFSRTFILGAVSFFAIYLIFNRKSKFAKLIFVLVILVLLVIIFIPQANEFFIKIVLKDNNLAGRDDLSDLAVKTFNDSSLFQKLWGQGVTKMQSLFTDVTSHQSVHNAYLQILLCFGVSGLMAILLFLFTRFLNSIKIIRHNRFIGVANTAMVISCFAVMFFNTTMLFNSSVDSFFLTVFMIIVPKYVGNAILNDTFDDTRSNKSEKKR